MNYHVTTEKPRLFVFCITDRSPRFTQVLALWRGNRYAEREAGAFVFTTERRTAEVLEHHRPF